MWFRAFHGDLIRASIAKRLWIFKLKPKILTCFVRDSFAASLVWIQLLRLYWRHYRFRQNTYNIDARHFWALQFSTIAPSFCFFVAGDINDDDQLLKTPDDGTSHNLYLYQVTLNCMRNNAKNLQEGQWLWLSWQRGSFRYHCSAVRIQSSRNVPLLKRIYRSGPLEPCWEQFKANSENTKKTI